MTCRKLHDLKGNSASRRGQADIEVCRQMGERPMEEPYWRVMWFAVSKLDHLRYKCCCGHTV